MSETAKAKKNPYAMFDQNEDLEKVGVVVDYGTFRCTIARAGGGNQLFKSVFKQLSKPYRRQLDNEALDDKTSERLMADVYSRAVILKWETAKTDDDGEPVLKDGKTQWEPVLLTRDGTELQPTPENIADFLVSMPELFNDIKAMAMKASNYLKAEIEEDAKN